MHDQSGRVQLQDEEYLETPKASGDMTVNSGGSFPCHTSSRQCRAMTNRLFVLTPSNHGAGAKGIPGTLWTELRGTQKRSQNKAHKELQITGSSLLQGGRDQQHNSL